MQTNEWKKTKKETELNDKGKWVETKITYEMKNRFSADSFSKTVNSLVAPLAIIVSVLSVYLNHLSNEKRIQYEFASEFHKTQVKEHLAITTKVFKNVNLLLSKKISDTSTERILIYLMSDLYDEILLMKDTSILKTYENTIKALYTHCLSKRINSNLYYAAQRLSVECDLDTRLEDCPDYNNIKNIFLKSVDTAQALRVQAINGMYLSEINFYNLNFDEFEKSFILRNKIINLSHEVSQILTEACDSIQFFFDQNTELSDLRRNAEVKFLSDDVYKMLSEIRLHRESNFNNILNLLKDIEYKVLNLNKGLYYQ